MRSYIEFLLMLFIAGSLFSGMAAAETKKAFPDSVYQLLANAKKTIKSIDMEQFKIALDKHDFDMIIDVREPGEFAAGYIPGAINIPRGVIEFKIWPYVGFPQQTDTSKKLILYCKTSGRCSLAAKSLQDLGFTNVMAVNMKFVDWLKAGYPIEKNE